MVATIGNITFTACRAATRRTARSCARSSAGSASASRIPRSPRNGFASGRRGRNGSGLSAPTSSVRRTSGRPPSAAAIAVYVRTCSSSPGGSVRARKRNSVRSRPTPSAPASTAATASSAEPRLASNRDPAPVTGHGRLRGGRERRPRPPPRAPALPPRSSASHLGARLDVEAARVRRRGGASLPSGTASSASPSPTAAGIPASERGSRVRGGTAAAVARPRTRPRSSAAVSAGVRSAATTIPGAVQPRVPSHRRPRAWATTCAATRSHVRARPLIVVVELAYSAATGRRPRQGAGRVPCLSKIARRAGRAARRRRGTTGARRRSPPLARRRGRRPPARAQLDADALERPSRALHSSAGPSARGRRGLPRQGPESRAQRPDRDPRGRQGRPARAPARCRRRIDRRCRRDLLGAIASKPSAASSRSASSAASACGPLAATCSSWPCRTPSVATALRLRALAGPRPVVDVGEGRRRHPSAAAVWTKLRGRAARAGRAGS